MRSNSKLDSKFKLVMIIRICLQLVVLVAAVSKASKSRRDPEKSSASPRWYIPSPSPVDELMAASSVRGGDIPMPGVGPLQGVSSWDWEKVDFFADKDRSSGSIMTGPCSMRSCEGSDLFAAIQADLRPWRQRGGISVADVNAAGGYGRELTRVTVANREVYAQRNVGSGLINDAAFLLVLLETLEHSPLDFPENVDFVLNHASSPSVAKRRFAGVDTGDNHLSPQQTFGSSSSSSSSNNKPLPFALSFAVHPDFYDASWMRRKGSE